MYLPSNLYSSNVGVVLKCLNSMINDEEAFEEDNVVATESAIGALGKLIYFHKQTSPQILTDSVI